MTQPYLSQKSQLVQLLNDQLEQVKDKKTLKLTNLNTSETSISEVVECIHEFIHNYQPPLEIERLSFHNNNILHLPSNFPIISSRIRYLDLHNNNLSIFPPVLSECRMLEILDISSNNLCNIPRLELLKLQNLRVISLKENHFKYLPPVLGELPNLNLIEVADNPLILPSHDIVKGFQNQSSDLDWVSQLKQYLRTNKVQLESHLSEIDSSFHLQKQKLAPSTNNSSTTSLQQSLGLVNNAHSHSTTNMSTVHPSTNANPASSANIAPPLISRSKSISETKSKASKAARRMGLIIKKTEENSNSSNSDPNTDGNNHLTPRTSSESSSHVRSRAESQSQPISSGPPPQAAAPPPPSQQAQHLVTHAPPSIHSTSGVSSSNGSTLNSSPSTANSSANTSATMGGPDENNHQYHHHPHHQHTKSQEGGGNLNNHILSNHVSYNRDALKIGNEYSQTPHSASATETTFRISSPPLPTLSTTTATTVPNSSTNSPSMTPVHMSNGTSTNVNNQNGSSSAIASSSAISSRPSSRNRSRSNTMKEIDSILEKNDNVDTEHKSGAYFRRLSTLQELPADETFQLGHNNSSQVFSSSVASSANNTPVAAPATTTTVPNHSSRHGSLSQQARDNLEILESARSGGIKSPPGPAPRHYNQTEVSPLKPQPARRATTQSASNIIKVSRKVLFSFSELHSSVRRFTGFCVDKKITIRMVSLLYTTKSNIDNLVENLEIMEESGGDNLEQITSSLHASIGSFKAIMMLLSENFTNFVAKIDVCFIRMLYLTIYGSFNELLNAYKILVPSARNTSPASAPSTGEIANSSNAQANNNNNNIGNAVGANKNLSVNTALANGDTSSQDTDEIDEKLYQTIELATTKAQVVFTEITKALNKSAVASTNSQQAISHAVAAKVKELTTICMSSMDITKRVRVKLITIRNNPSQTTKKLFWADVNGFLKAIVNTLGPVKVLIKDLPILNEARGSILNLTKTTKDVPILLEVSSYGALSATDSSTTNQIAAPGTYQQQQQQQHQQQHQQQQQQHQHHLQQQQSNNINTMFTPLSAHPSNSLSSANLMSMSMNQQTNASQPPVLTPLAATLGPAAQAVVSNNNTSVDLMNKPGNNGGGPIFSITSPVLSPGIAAPMATAPAQSSGQFYAKNGLNPFDGFIVANREVKEKEAT